MNGSLTTVNLKSSSTAPVAASWSTGELCTFVEASLLPWRGQERTVIVSLPAPAVAPEVMLRTADSSRAVLWAPPQGVVFAGSAAAHRIDPQGPRRLDHLGREAQALWRRVEVVEHPACGPVPAPRLFGGLAFAAGSSRAAPWQDFGDGCFSLPRSRYARQGREAWLSLAVRAESDLSPPRWRALTDELRRILEGLEAAGAAGLPQQGGTGVATRDPQGRGDGNAVRSEEPSPQRWVEQIEAIRRAIAQGSFRKIVAARRLELALPQPVDAAVMLRRLADRLPTSTRFAFVHHGRTFLGATPERLISRRGLDIETEALAGSISTNGSQEEQAKRLLESRKDQLEHALVVQHLVERLEPHCHPLRWSEGPGIRVLGDVLHLRTPIRGRLRAPTHVLRLVEALHPTPAVGGVPAREAVRWIVEKEAVPRGWYAGPIGWFDAAGDGEFAVALRSGLLEDGRAYLYAGAGIVQDSDPDLEYLETEWKQRAILGALGVAPPVVHRQPAARSSR